MNNEDKEAEEAGNEHQHEDTRQGTSRQTDVIKNEAYKMSTGNFKRNGQANSYLFFMAKPTPVSNVATWSTTSKWRIQKSIKVFRLAAN